MTATTVRTTIRISAVPAMELARIRAQGRDDHGNAFAPWVDTDGGAPLRCCLRDSRPGERIALIAYRPVRQPGPYSEVGPIFVHAEECPGYPEAGRYPDDFRVRTQVFRAYRSDGSITGGVVVGPDEDQEEVAAGLLADPEIAVIHSRNVVYGCFMFEIGRPAQDGRAQVGRA